MELFTAQYRYNGPDRLDITIKGKDSIGQYFAPSWEMVMKTKKETLSPDEYTQQYVERMRESYREHREIWDNVLSRERVVLVCFCPSKSFCHRYILADLLVRCGAVYMRELENEDTFSQTVVT